MKDRKMGLHKSTFEYLKPTENQLTTMSVVRQVNADYAKQMDELLPDGPDKTVIMRQIRDVGMWANVTITRLPDGTPRTE